MSRYKKGGSRANKNRAKNLPTNPRGSKANLENLPPADAALLEEQRRRKNAEKRASNLAEKAAQLQKKVNELQREAKNARDREKRHKKAKAAWQRSKKEKDVKIADLYLRAQCGIAEALADKRQSLAKLEKKLQEANAQVAKAHEDSAHFQKLSYKQKSDLILLRKTLHNLKRTVERGRRLRGRVLEKSHQAKLLSKMKVKHAYKPQMRTLVSCGCAEGKVGGLIKDVAAIFGVTIKKVMSRRTVRRIVLEGLVMANVQLGHEMNATEDLTLSGDSTSRRNQNYQAHHATYRVLEVLPDGHVRLSAKPQTRFMGIRSTVDHSTLKSKESWVRTMQNILGIYVDSPIAKRTAGYCFDLPAICRKLRGMSSDHANGEKATADAMKDLKREETMKSLGEERKRAMDVEEFENVLREWNWKKIEDAGGWEAYMALSAEDRAVRDIATVDAMMKSLGEEQFKTLPPEEQRLLTLFVWSGCCMHKDQNSFKGGNAAMMAAWKALGLTGPIILANKSNAPIIQKVVAPELGSKAPSEAELAALEASTFGGAKTASLAGAIFNNRCDKKGQGETHVIFLSHKIDRLVRRFPQTNNTRFGSHGEAAGELLLHLSEYREFLEHIKTKKVSVSWTNIELNVHKALHDDPTLTELAVLALYQQLITHPYMRMVRKPEQVALNALDLGPMHASLREHCEKLINNPNLILDFEEDSHLEAAFDGKPFEDPEIVDAIRDMVAGGQLKHLREMLVAFLTGAKVTWLRFSSEYAPGGLIDGMTDDEKSRAFMNATNDRNEGALGSWCVFARNSASSSMQRHNALAMFSRNHTQEFVNTYFGSEDHIWTMRAARKLDASGFEKARRKEQAEFELRMVEMKRTRIANRQEAANKKQELLNSTALITAVDEVENLTGKKLDLQLDKLRAMWGPRILIPKKKDILKVGPKKVALRAAFLLHLQFLRDGAIPTCVQSTEVGQTELLEMTVEAWHADEDEDEEMDEMDQD